MATSARRQDRAGLWRLVLALLAAAVVGSLVAARREAAALVVREEAALSAARRVLEAERVHRERRGRYGGLSELGQDGLLGADLRVEADGSVLAEGYRLDVLLPTGKDALGEVLLAPHGAVAHDPLLAARHVAVVARPVEPGRSGWRTYYLDETGRVYVSEGVCDAESALENHLPRVRVTGPHLPVQPGPVWRPLDDIDVGE
jgi:hypothetical protein